ncbi:hypothetical protein [Mameliella alba]|uniref:hypothetical protein n=1 Tax=Mameliella alba TaxID=561184 RepID=UPI000B532F81|nr:hypothetical protein [Mameliella alba]MBY6121043.1 hypothetical protein [Mameliella alba]OWV41983.1 hypothetical protein CDZ95_15605 [Mameliella alba]OWV62265.1 hypothetical protein CDZ97_15980 [Mameliella alba]
MKKQLLRSALVFLKAWVFLATTVLFSFHLWPFLETLFPDGGAGFSLGGPVLGACLSTAIGVMCRWQILKMGLAYAASLILFLVADGLWFEADGWAVGLGLAAGAIWAPPLAVVAVLFDLLRAAWQARYGKGA